MIGIAVALGVFLHRWTVHHPPTPKPASSTGLEPSNQQKFFSNSFVEKEQGAGIRLVNIAGREKAVLTGKTDRLETYASVLSRPMEIDFDKYNPTFVFQVDELSNEWFVYLRCPTFPTGELQIVPDTKQKGRVEINLGNLLKGKHNVKMDIGVSTYPKKINAGEFVTSGHLPFAAFDTAKSYLQLQPKATAPPLISVPNADSIPTCPALQQAGIYIVAQALERRANILEYARQKGRRINMHVVLWYDGKGQYAKEPRGWECLGHTSQHPATTHMPLAGLYRSDQPQYLRYLVRSSKDAGIQSLHVDYYGTNHPDRPYEKTTLPLLFQIADQEGEEAALTYELRVARDGTASRAWKNSRRIYGTFSIITLSIPALNAKAGCP